MFSSLSQFASVCKYALIFGFYYLITVPYGNAQIQINELLASTNQTTLDGTSLEWIELRNAGDAAVDLTGYSLSDDLLIPYKWLLPSVTLQPNAFLLVYTTGLNQYGLDEYHANFRLDKDGETISLTAPNGVLEDRASYPDQQTDVSYGRDPSTPTLWRFFSPPTPGQDNPNNGYLGFAESDASTITAGRYDNPVTVQLIPYHQEAEIRYALDGTEPDGSSALYTAPIVINQTSVIRSRTFREGYLPSEITTRTYIIRDNINRPIISLTTDPDNLWDRRTGIYANATASGDAWERPVHMEYFSTMGTLLSSEDAGVRMHGGASRNRAEKKSFRLYFRSDYGPKRLDAPVIPDAFDAKPYDKLVLRAGYNDSWIHWSPVERDLSTYVYDQLCRNLSGDMNAAYSRGDYADLYLNGEYWGFYNICERIEGDMMEPFYGTDEWIIVKDEETNKGDPNAWKSFQSFIQRANFANGDEYESFQQMVDLEQLTDYYILNIWVSNTDWPSKNFYAVRESHENGLWRFVIWDIEWSFGAGGLMGNISANAFQNARSTGGTLGTMLNKLLRSDQYQQYFLDRLEYNLSTVLSNEHVNQRFDELLDRVRPFMPRESERWDSTRDLDTFDSAIAAGKNFIEHRSDTVRQHIYGYLDVPTPTPAPHVPVPTPTPGGPPTATPTPSPTMPPAPTPTPTPTPTIPVVTELGVFENHLDIGSVDAAGNASYDSSNGTYRVSGSGADVWGQADEFHFMYKKISGPFVLDAQADAINHGSSDWAKVMLMARNSLDSNSPNFAARIRESIMEVSSQWRSEQSGTSFSTDGASRIPSNLHDGRIRIVRENDVFQSFYFDTQQSDWIMIDEVSVPMENEIYVGLAVTSHEDGSFAEGVYHSVHLQYDAPVLDWALHAN